MIEVDKSQYPTQQDYQAAIRAQLYANAEPIDPKLAGECAKDKVDALGEDSIFSAGSCVVAQECTYSNDKMSGVSGFCIKAEVGIRQDDR